MSQTTKIAYLEVTYSGDSFDFHELIRHILSRPEFQVFTLRAEMADVNEIQILQPDIIIMDLRRPQSPNLELHYKIIENETLKHLPVLMITEKSYDSTPLGFEGSEIDDYVCYPLFDESAFLSRMKNLLQRAESST